MDILTGTIAKIFEYTVEPIGRQVGYLINYKSNLESLRRQLKNLDDAKDRMKHRVDKVERNGKGVETDVQNWRKEADGITQEAEKILGNEGQAKTKCFRGVCPNLVSYHQFSRKSTKLAKKIELHAKKEFPSVSYDPPLEEICATPSQNYMAFESRILMVNEIMKELKNPDTNMIGVYGWGGVGKTTLAQEVYRQATKENLFDEAVIVLDVKKYPDLEKMERIQKKIAEKLGMDVNEIQDIEARAKHLWNRIKDKNIFVILDDVWEAIDLEALGLRPMATCKILLTSRNRVSEMIMEKEFWLEVLSMEENWSLFEKMVGDVVKDDRIHEVATEIAKKCGGLPVSVVAVARSLRSATTLEEWRVALRDFKSFGEHGLAKSAYLVLEWSYNRLDGDELKPLFLLCGIIAGGGCEIFFSDLLKYAMGLSLVKNIDTVEEARDKLISLTKKLIKDYCLLLDIDDDGYIRMHELVRDVVMVIASKDNHAIAKEYGGELKEWPDRNFLEKCTAISLKSSKIPRLPEVPWVCPELRFFRLENHNIDYSLEIPGNYFEGMKELKVLDVTRLRIPSLPPSLQSLTNLQTLCLDQCVLGDIALVGQLTNLKILSLLKSKVKELPKEIGQLIRLQLLDLTGCSELELIPPGVISSLTSLEDLRMGSFKEWEGSLNDGRSNANVSELKQLRQLTALDIHIPDAKLLPANMFSDKRLERYTILIGDCWQYPRIDETSSNMLKLKLITISQFDQGIKLLLGRCEHLYLDGVEAANIISYILASDSGKQLKDLQVQNNDEVTSLINSSHAFPILESLSLDNLVNLETVCCGQLIAQPFQKLRSLTLRNLPKLIGFSSKGSRPVVTTEAEEIISENEIGGPTKLFMNGEVLIPNLTRLILHQCDGLSFLFSFSMATSLVQLTHLEIASCQIMEEIVTKMGSSEENTNTEETDVQYFLLDEKVGFPSLESLMIYDMPKLRIIWHHQLAPDSFRKLEEVQVSRCDSLVNIFPASVAKGLQQLRKLNVRDCRILEEIVAKEGVETTPIEEFVFPKVTSLRFENLPQLRSFYPGLHVSKWPLLQELTFVACSKVEIFASEYSRFQERLDSGPPIRQPFLLVDTIVLRQQIALHIHIPDAKLLPANMLSDTKLERYTILIGDCWVFPYIYGTSSNMLKLKLTTNSQFDQGIKLLLESCEDLDLDGVEAANIISYISASDRGKQLKKLRVRNNDEVTAVINSSHAFPNLESLSLDNLVNLETVCCGPTKLIMNGEVMMPNLTSLVVHGCSGLRFLFSFSMARSLVQLTNLEIASCQIMEEIVTKIGSSEENTDNIFPKLKYIQLQHLPSLTRFCSGSYVEFPSLEWLHLEDCSELGVFVFHSKSENVTAGKQTEEREMKDYIETDVQYFLLDEKVGFPNLESLMIYDMPKLRTIWHRQLAPDSFQKLKEVEVSRCDSLVNIFPASVAKGLKQLSNLYLKNCGILEEIVAKEGVETTPIEEFVFPKVTSLIFENLPQLRSFYPGLHVSKWPLLEELTFVACGKVEIFASEYSRFQERLDSGPPIRQPFLLVDKGNPFPNLETLSFDKNMKIWYEAHGPLPAELFINLKEIAFYCAHPQSFHFPRSFHFLQKLHNLEKLEVYGGPWKEIFVYEGTSSGEIDAVGTTLPHIKNLSLKKIEELMHLGNDNTESIFPNLEILKVYDCGRLKNLTSSAISFHNLTALDVNGCMGLKYLVNYSVAKCLHQLETLEVWSCESITEIVACKGDEEDSGNYYEIAFSSLQRLVLYNLPSLQGFCSSGNCTIRVPSLNSLIVEKCLIELTISLDGSLIQSSSRPERLQITGELEEEKEKEKED